MNILMVLPIYPWPVDSGWAQRFHLVAESLATRNNVTILAHHVSKEPLYRNSPLENSCKVLVAQEAPKLISTTTIHEWGAGIFWTLSHKPKSLLRRRSSCLVESMRQIRAQAHFDCVWAARVWIAEMAREVGFRRIVVDVDDVPSVALSRRLATECLSWKFLSSYIELLKLRAYERTLSVRFWKIVVSKSEDLPRHHGHSGKWFVVPNGIVIPLNKAQISDAVDSRKGSVR